MAYKHRIKNGKLWVLVEAYVAPCGMVAHWCSWEGEHSYEPFVPKVVLRSRAELETHSINALNRAFDRYAVQMGDAFDNPKEPCLTPSPPS